VKLFFIALQFLTILPVKIKANIKPEDFGRSLAFFPVVGMLLGLFSCSALFLFSFLPHMAAVAIVLTVSVISTGAIHLDGFADTCDGLCGSKTKDRALEIMRDSHAGAMGVIGIVTLLILKFAFLFSLPREDLWKFLILAPIFSRWVQVLACFTSDYARQEGKAKYFVEFSGKREIFIATLFTLAAFFLLMRVEGLILCLAAALPVYLSINFINKKIDGMTGDTIGAVSELAEVFVLFFGLIIAGINIW